ncbi:MAG: hypothetical protein AAF965_04190, partial [Pseudomonadota bacterium]
TDQLKQLVDQVLQVEGSAQTQQKLQDLSQSLQQLANQPQEPNQQSAMVTFQAALRKSLEQFNAAFSPQDLVRLMELDEQTFSSSISDDIAELIVQNPMSPRVVFDHVNSLHGHREETFESLRQLSQNLEQLGFGYDEIEEGKAELGFQIPRKMFDDNLEGLIKELNEIKRMLRIVSEAAVGDYSPPQVGSISTSDPLIFFGLGIEVAKYFAGAVTWGIGVWYSVEQIRKVRAETQQIQAFTKEEVEEIFDSKIQNQIDQAVEAKVQEILKEGNPPEKRLGDLQAGLKWFLESLLAKMERGMTVELRLSPPPEPEVDGDGKEQAEGQASADYEELVSAQREMVFPKASEDPVLSIPQLDQDYE